jgi:hypothetical protein
MNQIIRRESGIVKVDFSDRVAAAHMELKSKLDSSYTHDGIQMAVIKSSSGKGTPKLLRLAAAIVTRGHSLCVVREGYVQKIDVIYNKLHGNTTVAIWAGPNSGVVWRDIQNEGVYFGITGHNGSARGLSEGEIYQRLNMFSGCMTAIKHYVPATTELVFGGER